MTVNSSKYIIYLHIVDFKDTTRGNLLKLLECHIERLRREIDMKNLMDIFKGMDVIDAEDMEDSLFKEEEKKQTTAVEKEVVQLTPEELVYFVNVKCPVCEAHFEERVVRKSKLRLLGTDQDLRPNYEVISPSFYDVQICTQCGYAALASVFKDTFGKNADLITEKITPKYQKKVYPLVLSVDDAIERYKYALLNAMVKKTKESEKAYIMMKLAWLHRDKGDEEQELFFIQNALDGFVNDFSNISFPVFGINEVTLSYVISVYYKRVGNNEDALKWLANVITNQNVAKGLKDRAIDLKTEITGEKKAAEVVTEKAPVKKKGFFSKK